MKQTLRGFVAQGMDGRKFASASLEAIYSSNTASSGSYTPKATVLVFTVATGAGGYGSVGSPSAGGAGGGAAGFKKCVLTAGQTIQWTVGAGGTSPGAAGAATTVTIPGLGLLVAGGGQGGAGAAGGAGGRCSGPWDIARAGGDGGAGGITPTAGGSPFGGGVGGSASGQYGGGGAAAGFIDLIVGSLMAGNGAGANLSVPNNTAPGGALGGASLATTSGAPGGIFIAAVAFAA